MERGTDFKAGDWVTPKLRGAFADRKSFQITELRNVGGRSFALGSVEGSYPVDALQHVNGHDVKMSADEFAARETFNARHYGKG